MHVAAIIFYAQLWSNSIEKIIEPTQLKFVLI